MSIRRHFAKLFAAAFVALSVPGVPGAASADAPKAAPTVLAEVPAAVLAGLSVHAANFEKMKLRGGYTFDGKVEELDGAGHPSDTKEIKMRILPKRGEPLPLVDVIRYFENGEDKTTEVS